jgi:SAM-dependent methyltransferase
MIEDWMALARDASADDLRERILTGFKDGKPFTPYRPTIALPGRIERVLDFGCGVGRNFPFLREVASHVTGTDLPPMIERCRELAPAPVDALSADWEGLTTRRFDLIFTTLVLQHVEPARCARYLTDFARMSPAVYLLSRAGSDFGTNVFRTCAETGAFEAGDCVEVEHDDRTHQLRVIDVWSFADVAARAPHDAHYEVMLLTKTPVGS